jgi:exodeoxyribonuclease V alpha subunit
MWWCCVLAAVWMWWCCVLAAVWSLTVHRAQGSEYPAVVVCLDGRASPLLTRQWLYTAVTRARRVCVVIGTERAYRRAFSTPAPVRQSALADLLRQPV